MEIVEKKNGEHDSSKIMRKENVWNETFVFYAREFNPFTDIDEKERKRKKEKSEKKDEEV